MEPMISLHFSYVNRIITKHYFRELPLYQLKTQVHAEGSFHFGFFHLESCAMKTVMLLAQEKN